jgi:DNA invertase Pin-like site-specific DNA recombinase
LREAGATRVFAEKVSGAKTDRAQLAKAPAALGTGDTLVVCKLDSLARSTRDLLNALAAIAEGGATFQISRRSLVRYNYSARPTNVDRAGRACGV